MTATEGLTVTQRRYVSAADAHYGGNLVDGAYVLALFGDVATEACIRMDGDEGLFASYSDVQFRAPVLGGDVIETTATVTRVGRRSRDLAFEARVVCRADELHLFFQVPVVQNHPHCDDVGFGQRIFEEIGRKRCRCVG